MGLTYDGITYRSLEEQVRYDAEQVQLLKQADVTINENLQTMNESLQTVNTELNGKLTKPANPTAESAVTMLADGTVGTKLLSEIGGGGGGKLYLHKISVSITGIEGSIYINIINTSNTSLTENEYFRKYLSIAPTVASFSGPGGAGAVIIRYIDTLGMYRVDGAVAGDIATGYYLANSGTISSFNDIITEL